MTFTNFRSRKQHSLRKVENEQQACMQEMVFLNQAHISNLNTQKVKTEGSGIQGYLCSYRPAVATKYPISFV